MSFHIQWICLIYQVSIHWKSYNYKGITAMSGILVTLICGLMEVSIYLYYDNIFNAFALPLKAMDSQVVIQHP
jgi:hypothetical protein